MATLTRAQRIHQAITSGPHAASRKAALHKAAVGRLNNPDYYGVGANLSVRGARQQAASLANQKFGPQLTQLGTQLSQADPVYDAYKASVAKAQQDAATAQQQATQEITGRSSQAQAQDLAQRSQLFQQMFSDAASRGATVDPALLRDSQNAASSRQQAANSDANLITSLGVNQQNFLGNQSVLGEGARLQRKQALQAQIGGLTTQKGDYRNTQLANLIGNAEKVGEINRTLGVSQQNANTARGVAQSNAVLKAKQIDQQGKLGRSRIRTTQRGQDINKSLRRDSSSLSQAQFVAKYGITPSDALKGVKPVRGLAGSGAGGLTPTQLRANNKLRDKAISTLALDPKKPTAKDRNGQIQWANALTAKLNVPHDLAVAIVDKFVFGSVDKPTADHIYQQYGVRLKTDPKPGRGALSEPHT